MLNSAILDRLDWETNSFSTDRSECNLNRPPGDLDPRLLGERNPWASRVLAADVTFFSILLRLIGLDNVVDPYLSIS
jgi:hypothetical protein